MSSTSTWNAPAILPPEPRFVLNRIGWGQYETILSALPEQAGLRMIYLDGRLTFLSSTRRHDWYAERLGQLVLSPGQALEVEVEDSGHATYRLATLGAGVEGDRAFYIGEHAEQMRGPCHIDLTTQPPPDLAIEGEVTHPADDAAVAWGRIGTPELWRLDTERWTLRFGIQGENGIDASSPQSVAFPALAPEDVLDQLKQAEQRGPSRWNAQLGDWVRMTLLPRVDP